MFWDPNSAISSKSRQVLTQYLTDAGLDGSNPNDVYAYRVLRQYYDGTAFAAQGQTFSSGAQGNQRCRRVSRGRLQHVHERRAKRVCGMHYRRPDPHRAVPSDQR